ncbi:protein NLP2-like [Cornus florida]|uniref:protein NLP2-like n=1 Tax=Cornus florida TaxID=4283 RepID=UPI0028A2B334|nr:protein NLP2-like [Cornus florida]XP_059655012.1 protein NLP2-like [Cornus florida]XP_059655013.1 protein NLP2-like [Cornus florida]
MEYPFSSQEKDISYWNSPTAQMEGVSSLDAASSEDPFNNIAELMNFDTGWCSTPSEQVFSCYATPPLISMPTNQVTQDPFNSFKSNSMEGYYSGEGMKVQSTPAQFVLPSDCANGDDSTSNRGNGSLQQNNISPRGYSKISRPLTESARGYSKIPRPISESLTEKMLRALSLFKESCEGGILAQIWMPIRYSDQYILSTCEQPYLLDQMLEGYRDVSRTFAFSAELKSSLFPGLPGRVFISKVPEWTSNLMYYNKSEYLRVEYAATHQVRGSIALPIFESDSLEVSDMPCCAVLELVTTKEKHNFDAEIDNVCRSLQAVNLRSNTPPRLYNQCLSKNQRAALADITDVLRVVCHAHKLPLALTWLPCSYSEGASDEISRVRIKSCNTSSIEKCVLCIENTACYVNDSNMYGFVHACADHFLEQGQGVAGKALQSNIPFFSSDVKGYDISEYPLVHHARKVGLNAAVAIRLRSIYTAADDYILEFFLPVHMKGSVEQQLLLNNLSATMQRISKGMRRVSDSELAGTEGSNIGFQELPIDLSGRSCQANLNSINRVPDVYDSRNVGITADNSSQQTRSGSKRRIEKKRGMTEKNVSLSVLQQYFSGSLKDAAKSIGVCPTTLKRICRQHGIARWPSRKLHKVKRSLKKIQTVLDSVHGMEGGLKFDTATGSVIASGSIIQDFDANKISPLKKLEAVAKDASGSTFCCDKSNIPPTDCFDIIKSVALDDGRGDGVIEHKQPTSSGMTDSGSMMSGSSSSSPNFVERSYPKITSFGDCGSKITVKATYREDTIRFKFEPSAGCLHLYEEVSKRFKILIGTFQLKYLDDEEEWVMLANDSDLQECLEILDCVGTRVVKFAVRDVPCAIGSSGSSNCFLAGGWR